MGWLWDTFKEMANDFRSEMSWVKMEHLVSAGPMVGGVVVGLGTFAFLGLVVTGPIHDALFDVHMVTVGEDGPEYVNWWWSILGNTFVGFTMLARIVLGYVAGYIAAKRLDALKQSATGRKVLAVLAVFGVITLVALIFLPMLLIILD